MKDPDVLFENHSHDISSQRNMTKDPETLHRHLVCRFRIELEQNRTDKMFVHVVYFNLHKDTMILLYFNESIIIVKTTI